MENTDKHWQLWGELDPYRAVCYPEGISRDFWESGERYVERLLASIDRVEYTSALDFGCGVGRILRPLSRRFANVTGVDVSPAMLGHAQSNVPEAILVDEIPDGLYDLVHSCLVLQHIPMERGIQILRRLRSCVAVGGVLAFQVPTAVHHSLIYRLKHALPAARFLFNALQGKPLREPLMQMNAYPPEVIASVVEEMSVLPDCHGEIFIWHNR